MSYIINGNGIAVTASANLTGVVSVSVQENSSYQESVIQAFFTPKQAREFARQLEFAADRVEGEQVWCENEDHPHKPHILVLNCVAPCFSGRHGKQDAADEDSGLAQWEIDLLSDEPPF